jgi:hypothetical protein
MSAVDTSCLRACIARYRERIPGLAELAAPPGAASPAVLVEHYERCYPLLEEAMWAGQADFDSLLECYQSLFREQDALIRLQAESGAAVDERHHFILSIPVADRPAHLRACLESIHRQCELFGYGGKTGGVYARIQVVVAEDSREAHNIREHVELVEEYRRKGLQAVHFGQDEQYELLQSIPQATRDKLANILTTRPGDRFYLKGQAANRNLSILKCLQLTGDRDSTLYYFVDSDESFCVNRCSGRADEAVDALNYFHYIDKAFRGSATLLLTGKMVGDPPVSPSVMAANFLDDVTAFFERLSGMQGDGQCRFHERPDRSAEPSASGAIYHDMAGLFGYDNRHAAFPYRCLLEGAHDHAACLNWSRPAPSILAIPSQATRG